MSQLPPHRRMPLSVSYTHLDVYKRQDWQIQLGNLIVLRVIRIEIVFPVEFTELVDVYKRQGLESGTDFPEGVYDLCYQGDGFATVEIEYESGNIFYMDLGSDHSVIWRIPFEQSGIAVRVTEYDMDEGDLILKPSW